MIGIGGLHHSIAGAIEMLTAFLAGDKFTPAQIASFLGAVLLGNLIGGSIFVAILNYTHVRRTQTVDS